MPPKCSWFNLIPFEKAMDQETATAVLVVSTTVFQAWFMYMSFYWFANNCECI